MKYTGGNTDFDFDSKNQSVPIWRFVDEYISRMGKGNEYNATKVHI